MPRYHQNSKQVLRDHRHFADCVDDDAARLIVGLLNDHDSSDDDRQDTLPLDGANGPLFVSDWTPPRQPHSIRQENDEYACSCGARWGVDEGEEHP